MKAAQIRLLKCDDAHPAEEAPASFQEALEVVMCLQVAPGFSGGGAPGQR